MSFVEVQGPALQDELSREMAALPLQSTESQERRLARDGIAYTLEEFLDQYGQEGYEFWAYATPVLLTAADVDNLQAAEERIKPPRSLHRLARNTLNDMITAGVNSDIDRNLEQWFPWRTYIACHEKAYEIIGTGVTHAIAEYIPETRDSNRGYQQRLDFVIYRADGTRCRLHPGQKRSQDAKPIVY